MSRAERRERAKKFKSSLRFDLNKFIKKARKDKRNKRSVEQLTEQWYLKKMVPQQKQVYQQVVQEYLQEAVY
jgi:hypothetical protein